MTEVARFTDKYGDERIVHRTHSGLRVKRQQLTPALSMNQAVSKMIGARVKEERLRVGWTMEQLAARAGMASGHPKNRIWAIENATRGEGMRMGTVYAIACALGVEAVDLMPSVAEVAEAAGVVNVPLVPERIETNVAVPVLTATPKAAEPLVTEANGPCGASAEGNDAGTGAAAALRDNADTALSAVNLPCNHIFETYSGVSDGHHCLVCGADKSEATA